MKSIPRLPVYLLALVATILLGVTGCKKEENDDPLTVTDIDGNAYNTVTIGTQVWLKENLKTTKLNDGTVITIISDPTTWSALTSPGLCWYDNSNSNKTTYGGLYNWYVVNTGKLCPAGWHVPSDAEWTTLATSLGGYDVAGGKMKESGTSHWVAPNNDATNESKFTGLPGGQRSSDGGFDYTGTHGFWWSSTGGFAGYNAICRALSNNIALLNDGNINKETGLSIRCVKD